MASQEVCAIGFQLGNGKTRRLSNFLGSGKPQSWSMGKVMGALVTGEKLETRPSVRPFPVEWADGAFWLTESHTSAPLLTAFESGEQSAPARSSGNRAISANRWPPQVLGTHFAQRSGPVCWTGLTRFPFMEE